MSARRGVECPRRTKVSQNHVHMSPSPCTICFFVLSSSALQLGSLGSDIMSVRVWGATQQGKAHKSTTNASIPTLPALVP